MHDRTLLDKDGENRALRTFLLQYGLPGLTVGAMAEHMSRSGWDYRYWPGFVRGPAPHAAHLTKAGAQIWIRHLISMEPPPVSEDLRKAQSLVKCLCLAGKTGRLVSDFTEVLDALSILLPVIERGSKPTACVVGADGDGIHDPRFCKTHAKQFYGAVCPGSDEPYLDQRGAFEQACYDHYLERHAAWWAWQKRGEQ